MKTQATDGTCAKKKDNNCKVDARRVGSRSDGEVTIVRLWVKLSIEAMLSKGMGSTHSAAKLQAEVCQPLEMGKRCEGQHNLRTLAPHLWCDT